MALQAGKRLDRWIVALRTPGPPRAMRHIAGINMGNLSLDEAPNRAKPRPSNEMEIRELVLGPHLSRDIPIDKGPRQLKKAATTNMP